MNQPLLPTALIAEDEPLLATALQQELGRAWPELQVAATVGDGLAAAREALRVQPDVLFFDIRMPGQSGLDAAIELADAWDTAVQPFPALVFITAYDQYAVQAFEAQAVDYLLKPVQPQRLQLTVRKLQQLLLQRATPALEQTLAQLRQLVQAPGLGAPAAAPAPPPARLEMIQAASGAQIHFVPVAEVVYFEAADKYVRVITAAHEYLVRTPLKELAAQLDPAAFWQVHRGTLVRASAIAAAVRDESGRLHLRLRERPERLPVSRLYAHLFKGM